MEIETMSLHAGYNPANGEADALPIYQSTPFRHSSTDSAGNLFDLKEAGFFYSRIGNPTVDAVEKKIATMEGGVGAMCTSSGQAANLCAVLNIAECGDSILVSQYIYGGTLNLFAVTLKKFGIETIFFDPYNPSDDAINALIKNNTKLIFGETLSNPGMEVFDIERFAKIAHNHGLPLIIDNTFATPCLCRPIEWGADIVVHSTTKYMDGHAVQMGGVIVDSGKFDWKASGKFPGLTTPDDSYHGLIYTDAFGNAAYIVKARVQLMRDLGVCQSAHGAFLINQGLETLPLRIAKHSENARIIAEWLQAQPQVESVSYPTLTTSRGHKFALKYLPNGCSGVIAFTLKGGRETAKTFIDSLKLVRLLTHVAEVRTCALHPASMTHRQLSDEQLKACGVEPGMVRLSVGLENVKDILDDLAKAMEQVK